MTDLTNTDAALAHFWHPVAQAAEVSNEPVAVRLLGVDWVLVRGAGGLSAFPDRCPHRRARLSAGRCIDDVVECRYHGWRFDAAGVCVAIPALGDGPRPERANLSPAAGVAESDGWIWLAPHEPEAPIPQAFAEHVASAVTVRLPVVDVPANAAMLCDNFLDEAHLPFVHPATIGGAGVEVIPRADIDRAGTSFTAVREHLFTNRTDPAVLRGQRDAVQRRRMTYRYDAPFAVALLLEYVEQETWQVIRFVVQPEADQRCRVFQTISGPDLGDADRASAAVAYEQSVFAEDLELQRAALDGLDFPLDPAAELHTRADRVAVEFRRVLHDAVSAAAGRL